MIINKKAAYRSKQILCVCLLLDNTKCIRPECSVWCVELNYCSNDCISTLIENQVSALENSTDQSIQNQTLD